jgi:hypothetical protein
VEMNIITNVNNILFIIFEHIGLAIVYMKPNVVEDFLTMYSGNLGMYGVYLGIYLRRNMIYFATLCIILELMFYNELIWYFIMIYFMTICIFVNNIYQYRFYIYPNYT